MDELQFWKQKVIQFFHDPPAKPFAFYPGTGGHREIAKDLFALFFAESKSTPRLKGYNQRPDWAAAGADRPMLMAPRGQSPIQLAWPTHPVLTHPLWPARLDLRRRGHDQLSVTSVREAVFDDESEILEDLRDPLSDWTDPTRLHHDFRRLWRRYRDELMASSSAGDALLWKEMPADSRSPDHSIWDHLRVATALAFLPPGKQSSRDPYHPQAPWLLRFSLHPVQRFIAEARSSRDLWIGSFLLADLSWHAMRPIVERYGHDCILYPDLRGNPHVDNWLGRHADDAELLPDAARGSATYAALLPANFTAVVPHGAEKGFLKAIPQLADECRRSVDARWREHADLVWNWLISNAMLRNTDERRTLEAIWNRQHEQVIGTAWSAVAWLRPEPLEDANSLLGRALPAQRQHFRSARDPSDLQRIEQRRLRLSPWVPGCVWNHYEAAREVYAHSNLAWHQSERGFDYALTHRQLVARHSMRKAQVPVEGQVNDEPGEKCTCCGRRQALTTKSAGNIAADRKLARAFWSSKALDPEQSGAERLCAVCAMKRFLIPAGAKGDELAGLNPIWAGSDQKLSDVADRDGKVRVPFPSTATIAAQRFIGRVVAEPGLEQQIGAIIDAHRAIGLQATSFPRSLARLAAAASSAGVRGSRVRRRFLELEADEVLFPSAIDGIKVAHLRRLAGKLKHDRERLDSEKSRIERLYSDLKRSCEGLRREAAERGIDPPQGRLAVLAMDGDRIGSLLLGTEDVIQARWRDVIHPEAVRQLGDTEAPRRHLCQAGWPALLDSRRLTGPSLHAFISRALAAFSHVIVPWVVERELGGRLIYSGGDELLCLVPGDEALDLAARLQQLFSAAWIIDTAPDQDPWEWRRARADFVYDPGEARRRFVVPRFDADESLRLPILDPEQLQRHVAAGSGDDEIQVQMPVDGRVIPLLGLGHSLSAGIAFGHYKTPLTSLLQRARRMLEHEAKERAGRSAIGISHASRGGEKNSFAMPWNDKGLGFGAHEALTAAIAGFARGQLAGRLPYKLRELAPNAKAILEIIPNDEPASRRRWLRGLFDQALGEGATGSAADAAFVLWQQGLSLYSSNGTQNDETTQAEQAVGGLLICRTLAGAEEDAE